MTRSGLLKIAGIAAVVVLATMLLAPTSGQGPYLPDPAADALAAVVVGAGVLGVVVGLLWLNSRLRDREDEDARWRYRDRRP